MFHRSFGIGNIKSDEGFSIAVGKLAILYHDDHGQVLVPYEKGLLFAELQYLPDAYGKDLEDAEIRNMIADRILSALEWDGRPLQLAPAGLQPSFDRSAVMHSIRRG